MTSSVSVTPAAAAGRCVRQQRVQCSHVKNMLETLNAEKEIDPVCVRHEFSDVVESS